MSYDFKLMEIESVYVKFDEDGTKSGILVTNGRNDYMVTYRPPVNFLTKGTWSDEVIFLNKEDYYLKEEINSGLWKKIQLNSIQDKEFKSKLKHKLHHANAFYGIDELENLAEQKIKDENLVKLVKKEINLMENCFDKEDFLRQVDNYIWKVN